MVLGLGSNIGNRQRYIKDTINMLSLKRNFLFIKVSGIYESEPWGFKNQNNFLNCVAVFLYRSDPQTLLKEIKEAEKNMGRTVSKKWHPREIDIDILFFGNKVLNNKSLMIPHPQIEFRNFVLIPLVQLMPGFVHPVTHKKLITLSSNSTDLCRVYGYK